MNDMLVIVERHATSLPTISLNKSIINIWCTICLGLKQIVVI